MLEYEMQARIAAFLGILVLVGLWEIIYPRKKRVASKALRWMNNLGLIFLNAMVLRFVFPFLAIGTAVLAEQKGWGVGYQLSLPYLPKIVLSVILLDMMIYLQHVVFHKFSFLWRLHQMHHIDPDLDVTSGVRFHPIEIVLSMVIKMGLVVLFGIPVEAVLIFEIVLNGSAMFNHGNIMIPLGLDRLLRWVIVTPDMHRVHHSVFREETDSNFGFFLSWWDRIFRTYKAQPQSGHDNMILGTGYFQDKKYLQLPWLLAVPFLKVK